MTERTSRRHAQTRRSRIALSRFLILALTWSAGCNQSSTDPAPPAATGGESTEGAVATKTRVTSKAAKKPSDKPRKTPSAASELIAPTGGSVEAINQGEITGPNTFLPEKDGKGGRIGKGKAPDPERFYQFGPR